MIKLQSGESVLPAKLFISPGNGRSRRVKKCNIVFEAYHPVDVDVASGWVSRRVFPFIDVSISSEFVYNKVGG